MRVSRYSRLASYCTLPAIPVSSLYVSKLLKPNILWRRIDGFRCATLRCDRAFSLHSFAQLIPPSPLHSFLFPYFICSFAPHALPTLVCVFVCMCVLCCICDRASITACFIGWRTESLCQGQADRVHYGKVIHEFTIECIYTLGAVCRLRMTQSYLKDGFYITATELFPRSMRTPALCARVCVRTHVDVVTFAAMCD